MKKILILLILFFLKTYSMDLGIQKNQEIAISDIENLPVDLLRHINHYLLNFKDVYNTHDVFKDMRNFRLTSRNINNKLKDGKLISPFAKIKLDYLEIVLNTNSPMSLEQIRFILKKNNQMVYLAKLKEALKRSSTDTPCLLRLWKEIEIIKKIEDKEIIDDIRNKIVKSLVYYNQKISNYEYPFRERESYSYRSYISEIKKAKEIIIPELTIILTLDSIKKDSCTWLFATFSNNFNLSLEIANIANSHPNPEIASISKKYWRYAFIDKKVKEHPLIFISVLFIVTFVLNNFIESLKQQEFIFSSKL